VLPLLEGESTLEDEDEELGRVDGVEEVCDTTVLESCIRLSTFNVALRMETDGSAGSIDNGMETASKGPMAVVGTVIR
jgi:hypothetical protein